VFYVWRRFEKLGNGQGVQAVRLHPEMERLRASLGEPAVVGTRDGADGVLEETELAGEGCMVGGEDEGTHDDVGVAVDVFRETVEDNVGTEE